ncbi:MAG: MBL fold metallo-hydrolase [Dehalococcoidales bacterium]|nr:MBL fold metallo-hydrolase [Dehalococcoidales bacterium]
MEITWLGHSCFRLKSKQVTVVTDPCSPDTGYALGKVSAQIVTVSHAHPGHSYVEGVSDNPKVIKGPGEYEISDIITLGLTTFHDNEHGAVRGKNTVYLMDIDDVMICHLGDLGHTLTAEQVAKLETVDVLLVPVGGGSTIDATQAAETVRRLEPKIVIPMHFKTEALKRDLATEERFLKEMGVKDIVPLTKLNITKANLPQSLQVTLLSYK